MLHVFVVQDAYAAGGEFGILEGRIFSLIHPIVMISLFVATGYAGYLGWQWRRVRTIQDDINALKKQVPVAAEGQTAPSPIEAQIKELSEVCTSIHIHSHPFPSILLFFIAKCQDGKFIRVTKLSSYQSSSANCISHPSRPIHKKQT